MDIKAKKHCKGCKHFHNAGHPEGSKLQNSKYNNWCGKHCMSVDIARSLCIIQNSKELIALDG